MARTEITTQDTDHETGLSPLAVEAANADGNSVVNNGRVVVFAHNSDTTDRTVTQITGGNASGLDIADPQVTVAAGDFAILGPWPSIYNQSDGSVWLDYDDASGLDVAAFEV